MSLRTARLAPSSILLHCLLCERLLAATCKPYSGVCVWVLQLYFAQRICFPLLKGDPLQCKVHISLVRSPYLVSPAGSIFI
jgi:hypothetical protein